MFKPSIVLPHPLLLSIPLPLVITSWYHPEHFQGLLLPYRTLPFLLQSLLHLKSPPRTTTQFISPFYFRSMRKTYLSHVA